MKKVILSTLIAASLLTACAVVPGRHGQPVIVPLLPPVVLFDAEPYYVQGGFHYHYLNNRWYYARSRSGPWLDLPRDHYPKEVRFKDRDRDRNEGGGDNRRDNDRRDR